MATPLLPIPLAYIEGRFNLSSGFCFSIFVPLGLWALSVFVLFLYFLRALFCRKRRLLTLAYLGVCIPFGAVFLLIPMVGIYRSGFAAYVTNSLTVDEWRRIGACAQEHLPHEVSFNDPDHRWGTPQKDKESLKARAAFGACAPFDKIRPVPTGISCYDKGTTIVWNGGFFNGRGIFIAAPSSTWASREFPRPWSTPHAPGEQIPGITPRHWNIPISPDIKVFVEED